MANSRAWDARRPDLVSVASRRRPGPGFAELHATLPPMNKLEVKVPHHLGRDEARARIDKVTEKLAKDFSAECTWEGRDRLVVKRKGLLALLDVADDNVHIDLELGLFMRPFAGTIRSGIEKQLSDILT
jgi:putative polyhydroxyalkanoate system protein